MLVIINLPPLNDLAREIHDNACAKGFWDDEERDRDEAMMLIVSELAEALEAHRASAPVFTTDPQTGKPEGITVELADAIIRCLDLLCYEVGEYMDKLLEYWGRSLWLEENFGAALLNVTKSVVRASEVTDSELWLPRTVALCWALIQSFGVDPESVIQAKHAYNLTREHKHGKAY